MVSHVETWGRLVEMHLPMNSMPMPFALSVGLAWFAYFWATYGCAALTLVTYIAARFDIHPVCLSWDLATVTFILSFWGFLYIGFLFEEQSVAVVARPLSTTRGREFESPLWLSFCRNPSSELVGLP